MAHKKGQGSTRNGRDSRPKYMGIKKYAGIELVSSIGGHWTLPGGVEATEAIVAGHGDIDLIFAASDMMGVGADERKARRWPLARHAGLACLRPPGAVRGYFFKCELM